MDTHINFNSLFIISILAFIIPIFVNKLKSIKIPVVVAEIFAGIIVGKTGLNLIKDNLWLDFLSLFGFAYLMFLSGTEIDFSYFKKSKTRIKNKLNPLLISIIIFISTLILAFIFSKILSIFGISNNTMFFTLIFSTTSLGIVVPVLKEKCIIDEPIGQITLLSALLADFLTMLLIPLVIFLVAKEDGSKLLTSLIIFIVFGIVYYIVKRFFKFEFDNSTYETSQLKVRAAFVLVLIFVKTAEIAEVEIILGTFLAGVLFSIFFDRFRTEISPKLDAIGYGFLIPIFFITVGASIDIKTVLNKNSLLIVPIFILIAYGVKIIPVLIIKKFFSWKETIGIGFLLSSRLSLIIAISIIALDLKIIDESMYSTFVIIAIITCIISPLIFQKLFPEREIFKTALVIAGNNEIILSVVKKLHNDDILILADINSKILNKFNEMNIEFIYWKKLSVEMFKELKKISVSTFISLYSNSDRNIQACSMAKLMNIKNIVSVINDPVKSNYLIQKGIKTVTPAKAMNILLYGLIKYSESFEVLYNPDERQSIDVLEMKVLKNKIIGKKIKRLNLPGDYLVLLILRSGRRVVPDGNTTVEKNDILVMIGDIEYTNTVEEIFK